MFAQYDPERTGWIPIKDLVPLLRMANESWGSDDLAGNGCCWARHRYPFFGTNAVCVVLLAHSQLQSPPVGIADLFRSTSVRGDTDHTSILSLVAWWAELHA